LSKGRSIGLSGKDWEAVGDLPRTRIEWHQVGKGRPEFGKGHYEFVDETGQCLGSVNKGYFLSAGLWAEPVRVIDGPTLA
jgi:hypothetical protein